MTGRTRWHENIYGWGMSMRKSITITALIVAAFSVSLGLSDTAGKLWLRGYAVVPTPQSVNLAGPDFPFGSDWRLQVGEGLSASARPVETLQAGLRRAFGWDLPLLSAPSPHDGKILRLGVRANAAAAGKQAEIARQAYVIELEPSRVSIEGNDQPGLFYGVQTFLQLVRSSVGPGIVLPVGRIEDWPALELREIHWDSKHHQERFETLKEYLDRAAEFKINAIGWEIEDKFAYQRHPVIGAPGAFTRQQVQELQRYALERHIEIIPLIQGPSHMAYVLKHPVFAHLREDIRNNYMICPSREESWKLIFDMYDEILEATPGGKYFHVATDEAYFLGDGKACGCAEKAKDGGRSRLFVEFMKKTSEYLEARDRKVMFWGEDPLEVRDIPKLPPMLIDAVAGSDEDEILAEKARGIRLMIYASAQGVRPFFPEYFPQNYPEAPSEGRLRSLYETIAFSPARKGDLLGNFTAAWDDSGLHNEVFWLGWVCGAAYGWHAGTPQPEELTEQFMKLFYGPQARGMAEVYRLMDESAQFWATSWDRVAAERGPSYKKYMHWDQSLALPHLPLAANLSNHPYWRDHYRSLLERAEKQRIGIERLIALLHENLGVIRRNRYNLEVLLSMAAYMRHNLDLLRTLARIEDLLTEARNEHSRLQYENAAARLRTAERTLDDIAKDRESTYQDLVETWEKSRLPKGQEVGGRRFVHIMDDTKDHWADRTPDLSYLVMRERRLNLEDWAERLKKVREEYTRNYKGNHRYAPDEP